MPVMDEFREEREALKHGTFKQKFSYFLDYYKWYVVAAAAVILFLVSMVHQMLSQKDNALFVAMVNGIELTDSEEHAHQFAEYAGIDENSYGLLFDTSMRIDLSDINSLTEDTITSSQKLMVYIAAQDVDLLISDESVMGSHAYSDTFWDLRDILTAEQITQYEPYFYYMDQAVAVEREEQDIFAEDYEPSADYPDGRNPEAMRDPIPVGLYLNDARLLNESFYFPGENVILGVVGNTKRLENAVKYIDFLLQQ